jgi:hypothetical protein
VTGKHLSPDLRAFVRLLHDHRVRYVVVGGEAVIHHGYPRLTGDMDFYYDRTPANCRRLFLALQAFWDGPVPAVDRAEELGEPGVVVQFGRPPNRIDLINRLGTVPFGRAWRRRVTESVSTPRGTVPLNIIGLLDLVQSKRDAGRHKDLDDVVHLTALHGTPASRSRAHRTRRTRSGR